VSAATQSVLVDGFEWSDGSVAGHACESCARDMAIEWNLEWSGYGAEEDVHGYPYVLPSMDDTENDRPAACDFCGLYVSGFPVNDDGENWLREHGPSWLCAAYGVEGVI
jgi:hypothetical protein